MQESWFCAQCKSMNRATSQQCYKCRAPKAGATLATVADRPLGVVLTPGLDEEHREVAWTLMFRQSYVSAWKLGYAAAALLFAMLAAGLVLTAMILTVLVTHQSADRSTLARLFDPLLLPILVVALLAILTIVVHSVFLYLTSSNLPALGSGSPRFDPVRAALWWIESALWAIRGGLAFVVPPFLAFFAIILGGPAFGLVMGIVWFVLAFWTLGDPITCLGKPKRLLADLWDRLGVPGSADSRVVTLWSAAWGTGRGLEYAVSGLTYLFLIALSIVSFGASRVGQEVAIAPENQIALAQTLLTVAMVTIQVVADGIGLFLLARITMELAQRQRVREEWVLGGLDQARAKAASEATLRDTAARSAADAGTPPWVSQPAQPWTPPEPAAEPEPVAEPEPKPASQDVPESPPPATRPLPPTSPPPAMLPPQDWQGPAQWPPAPKPTASPPGPSSFPLQPPEASQLQPSRHWPAAQPPAPEEGVSVAGAAAPADSGEEPPTIRPSAVGTPRYGSVQGGRPAIPRGESPEPATENPPPAADASVAADEPEAGNGPSAVIPDDPGLGEGL